MRPIKTKMMTITSTTPKIPDGKYPQEREYPQLGMAPISNKISTIIRIVLSILMYSLR